MIGNPSKPSGESGSIMLERMNHSHEPLRRFGFEHIKKINKPTILDIGCGGGATLHDFVQIFPDSKLYGIDYSETSVEKSKAFNKDYLNQMTIIQDDVSSLNFNDNTFDIISAVETVYFWPIEKGLKEVYRVLKPGGQFVILNEMSKPEKYDPTKYNFEMTVYHAETLKELMFKANFVNVDIAYGPKEYICIKGSKAQ